jgi:hypothetical protein
MKVVVNIGGGTALVEQLCMDEFEETPFYMAGLEYRLKADGLMVDQIV